MKYIRIFLVFYIFTSLISCGGDDDICESGEGTPRMKIMFKDLATNKLKKMDSLYVFVDYGKDTLSLGKMANVDSVLVPLRVDDSPFTDIFVKTEWEGTTSKIKVNYTTKPVYVSPACGVKKLYENVSGNLLSPNPVLQIENTQNTIENENKTNMYLLF